MSTQGKQLLFLNQDHQNIYTYYIHILATQNLDTTTNIAIHSKLNNINITQNLQKKKEKIYLPAFDVIQVRFDNVDKLITVQSPLSL